MNSGALSLAATAGLPALSPNDITQLTDAELWQQLQAHRLKQPHGLISEILLKNALDHLDAAASVASLSKDAKEKPSESQGSADTQLDTQAPAQRLGTSSPPQVPPKELAPRTPEKEKPIAPMTPSKPTPSIFAPETIHASPPPASQAHCRTPNTKAKSKAVPESPKPEHLSHMALSLRKKHKDLTDEDVVSQVPLTTDKAAPQPVLGKAQLSDQAIRMRSQRIFKRRANGSLKVTEEIWKEWHQRGSRRALLEEIFLQCGYDPATFVSEVEVIRAEMLENEVIIEGEYASSETMRSWGFSELFTCN
ncbi:unnamed protein product [Symbiodinium sp. CCMP2592]|nr:unnamed protein product [Symbiodinium sp. CCMP2592]CAE7567432.1 unnamed protein product [Symbiodinium sp. CCMP2592]